MRRASKLTVFLFSLTLLLCVCLAQRESHAAEPLTEEQLKALPPISGLTIQQIGSHGVIMYLVGGGLSRPEITEQTTAAVSFAIKPAYLASGRWGKQYNLPLVQSVQAEQIGDSVVFTVRINSPLELKGIEGVAPANSYTLQFETAGHAAREREQPALYEPKPPAPTRPAIAVAPTSPIVVIVNPRTRPDRASLKTTLTMIFPLEMPID